MTQSAPAESLTLTHGPPDAGTWTNALPAGWSSLWGPQPVEPLVRRQLREMRRTSQMLAEKVRLRTDLAEALAPLVGASDLRGHPVHRWFSYKEAFSPDLPGAVLDALGLQGPLVLADSFGGVATTALFAGSDPRIQEVRSVEWSPLAHWVGNAKLAWPELEPALLDRAVDLALDYPLLGDVDPPQLAAFRNREIFSAPTLRSLLSARQHLRQLTGLTRAELDFLNLGLVAVLEDCSGAMKDGRALRVLRGRRRTPTSLVPASVRRRGVKPALKVQWTSMIRDLRQLASDRESARKTQAAHVRGDARALDDIKAEGKTKRFPASSVDAFIFSPPYLNAIDYSEIYKLELWFLDFLQTQQDFRALREGTLRSHPSIKFEERAYLRGVDGDAVALIDSISQWVGTWSLRGENGPVVRQYFEDMYEVLRQQSQALKPGGVSVCVVANSTYARRCKDEMGSPREEWRIPLLTDVLLAHLARSAGFGEIELWEARDLRPRNVRGGRARESLVVARKQ